ncbi:MAG: nicotinate phosphoribosyltransferase [Helicobacteraceae bacterium]|jgi:nicotinate phosphoribosyltransferase|nr:nicotinate phosphoribosyltransferase [Helicobacteraceae bacterium]
MGIIKSLLDQDLYKITMQRVYFHRFSNATARYEFRCRDESVVFTEAMFAEIDAEIKALDNLKFEKEEIDYIGDLYYMKEARGYLEFLRLFRLNSEYIRADLREGKLSIVAEGPIWLASMYEIFVLAIVSEVYFKRAALGDLAVGRARLDAKIDAIKQRDIPFKFSDFGTRRRYSLAWMDEVIAALAKNFDGAVFTGTSNLYFAKKYNLIPMGTLAHEYLCLGQALDVVTIANSQRFMLQTWADEYRGDLGIALSDNLGSDYFFQHDFDKYFSLLFSGVRQDSGDPIEWGRKTLEHYEKYRIDPRSKTLVFSDALDFPRAFAINREFYDKANVAFGIGTNLTNDMGVKPLNIVFKMVSANGRPVAKLSDSPTKLMCEDQGYVEYLKSVIDRGLSPSSRQSDRGGVEQV